MPVETDVTALDINKYTLGDAVKDKRMWVDTYQRNYSCVVHPSKLDTWGRV
jgi:hypothetical protein